MKCAIALALLLAAAGAQANDAPDGLADTQSYAPHYASPLEHHYQPCACVPGWGGSPCAECPAGTYSAGGTGATCTSCGAGLTSPAGSTSSAACLSAACIHKGFKAITIPSDGTPITDIVTPKSCFDLVIDETTEDCCSTSAGETVAKPAAPYFIAAAPVPRNITVTTCISMARDPVSVEYSVDPAIFVYESNAACEITFDATQCSDDWSSDNDAVIAICEDDNSDYNSFLFAELEANKDYLIITNYYSDMSDYCSCPIISTPLVTTFQLNTGVEHIFKPSGSLRTSPRRNTQRISREDRLEKRIASLKAKSRGKASKMANKGVTRSKKGAKGL